MAEPLTFGLSENILNDIRRVVTSRPGVDDALLYGSRARGTARPDSDIDIAIVAPGMTDADFATLWSQLDDLPIVYKMDVLHWDRLQNTRLKEIVRQEGKSILR